MRTRSRKSRTCRLEALEHRTLMSVTAAPPVLFEDHYQFTAGVLGVSNVSVLANDRDPAGGGLTASLLQGPKNGTLTLKADGTFTYQPKSGFTGSDLFFYRATDVDGKQSIGNAYLTVIPSQNQDPAGVYNVRTFGAKGDATTDDTLAIRAALAAAEKAGGGTVYFPPGTYLVSPQPGDANWPVLSDPNYFSKSVHQAIFYVTSSNIQFKGDGAGVSTISVKTLDPTTGKTGADPNTTWSVVPVPNSSQKLVFRGGAFRLGNAQQDLTNISFTGLRITGNTLATTDATVGGTPSTGTGWDMSHKAIAIDSPRPVELTIDGCQLDRWRGEIVFAGGTVPSKVTIRNTTIEECNGSAVATSAWTTIDNSTIRNCYNGTENFCLAKGQGLVVRNTKFETTRPGNWVHGIVYEGGKGVGASMAVTGCSFQGFHRGIYLAGGAENVTVSDSSFKDELSGILVGAVEDKKIFANLNFANNSFALPNGTAILLNSYRTPTSNVTIQGNTVAAKLFLSDTSRVRSGLLVKNNKISASTIYAIEADGVQPGLWTGNQYVYSDALWRHFRAITDRTDVKAGTATITPTREAYGVQLLGGGDVKLNLSLTPKYPAGYSVTLLRYGDTRGTMRIMPASWNTLTAPLTVTTSGVTLRRRSDGKFELPPTATSAVVAATASTTVATQAAALLSYVNQSSSATQPKTAAAIDELAQLRARG